MLMTIAARAADKPNILVIFGDDSAPRTLARTATASWATPHLTSDRLANEGMRFLHYYGEPFPSSFNPANILEERLRDIKAGRKFRAAFPIPAARIEAEQKAAAGAK